MTTVDDTTSPDDTRCWTTRLTEHEVTGKALMGPAHAISACGVFFLALGVYTYRGNDMPLESNLALLTLSFIAVIGGVLIPDLDNNRSTVEKALGFTGNFFSAIFRESSRLIQKTVRTSRDDADPNPHRGFWHTIVGACVLGVILWSLTLIPWVFTIPFIGHKITVGTLCAFVVLVGCFNITIAGLGYDVFSKKMEKIPVVGNIASVLMSLVLTGMLLFIAPETNFVWLGISVAIGCIIHILGDALTKAGVPIFFPVIGVIKGKMWWKTRFTSLSADSAVLNGSIYWLSIVATVIGITLIVLSL